MITRTLPTVVLQDYLNYSRFFCSQLFTAPLLPSSKLKKPCGEAEYLSRELLSTLSHGMQLQGAEAGDHGTC